MNKSLYDRFCGFFKYKICYPIEKLINTLMWVFIPHSKIIVANVYLRHILTYLYKENLGDDLNFILLRYLSGKIIVNYLHSYLLSFKPINYMCIGSIVRRSNKKSIIWGSGAIEDNLDDMIETPLKVVAVRGPLTRNLLLRNGIDCPAIYGDPAILFPLIYPCKREKKYKLGIIPHFLDYSSDKIRNLEMKYEDVIVIKMSNYNDWKEVINQINECDFIVSSSLHGLILSDTYGVPNVWIKLSDKVIGGNFKFIDYYRGSNRMEIENPIDYSMKNLCLEELLLHKPKYIKPEYQIDQLLDVCPFADKSVIRELKQRIIGS